MMASTPGPRAQAWRRTDETRDDTSEQQQFEQQLFAGVCPTGRLSLLEVTACDPQASSDGHDHRAPPGCSRGHTCRWTPTRFQAGDRCHSRTCSTSLGLSDAAGQATQFIRLFSGDIQVAQGAMRPFGGRPVIALSMSTARSTTSSAVWNGNGFTAMAGPFRVRRRLRGQALGDATQKAVPHGLLPPGAEWSPFATPSVQRVLAQEFMHALGFHLTLRLIAGGCREANRAQGPGIRRIPGSFVRHPGWTTGSASATRVGPVVSCGWANWSCSPVAPAARPIRVR